MRAVSSRATPWQPYPSQRSTTIQYKGLLQGVSDAPDNYELSIDTFGAGGTFSPRHRHNFDQFRWAMNGPLNYSPKVDIPIHQLGYFPEGAYYGPQQIVEGSLMLIVQFGGASGQGYVSWDRLMQGTEELKTRGVFEGGIYKSVNADGKRTNQDGYEAVWEQVSKRKLVYPKPRYDTAITIDPQAFAWMAVAGQKGVSCRHFGTFNERGTAAWQLRIAAGATLVPPDLPNITLMYLLSGRVRAAGAVHETESAFSLDAHERAEFTAIEEATLLCFAMPDFSAASA